MGRQGPKLVPFLQKGLINRKYRNLIPEDTLGLKFSIIFPHKTKKLHPEDELIFMDWYALNGKKYIFGSKHYTDAKQAMTASLRKSDYVEKVHVTDDKLTYRILNKTEVKEKKKLKKELKKKNELKAEALDSDDAVSSEESGYGSGSDSPLNDYPLMSNTDNLIAASGKESSQTSHAIIVDNSVFGINDVLESSCHDKCNGFPKSEPVDACMPVANSLADPNYLTGIQPFADILKSADLLSEDTPHLNLMDCFSGTSELNNLDFAQAEDFQLDNLSDNYLSNELFKDFPMYDINSPFVCEGNLNNQASDIQNVSNLSAESEDILTEDLFKKLLEDVSTANSVDLENYYQKEITSSPGVGVPDHKTEANENIYYCRKCIHLGKIPVLFCEPQFENKSTDVLSEIKIAFEESILKEISGFKSVTEYKFINDHLMVILEPNDD